MERLFQRLSPRRRPVVMALVRNEETLGSSRQFVVAARSRCGNRHQDSVARKGIVEAATEPTYCLSQLQRLKNVGCQLLYPLFLEFFCRHHDNRVSAAPELAFDGDEANLSLAGTRDSLNYATVFGTLPSRESSKLPRVKAIIGPFL